MSSLPRPPGNASFAWLAGAHAGYRSNPDASFVDSGILSGLGGFSWRRGAAFGRANADLYWSTRDGSSNESYRGASLLLGYGLFNCLPQAYIWSGFGQVESVLLVVAAINLHHFIVDGYIWKLGRGDSNRRVVESDLPAMVGG